MDQQTGFSDVTTGRHLPLHTQENQSVEKANVGQTLTASSSTITYQVLNKNPHHPSREKNPEKSKIPALLDLL